VALHGPAAAAPVDEPGVPAAALVGPDAHPLDDAGSEALDEGVGLGRQPQHDLDIVLRLQIDGDGTTAPRQGAGRITADTARPARHQSIDPDHVGAEIAQQLPAQRNGAQRGELDHPQARERSTHGLLLVRPDARRTACRCACRPAPAPPPRSPHHASHNPFLSQPATRRATQVPASGRKLARLLARQRIRTPAS
jgi:hypothetical protein